MTSTIEIKDLCRTCLATEYVLYPIFETFLESIPLADAVSSITGLKLDENDGLPKKICENCKDIAIKAYLFKKKSWESDVSIQDLFKREKASFDYEDKSSIEVKIEKLASDDNFNTAYGDHSSMCIDTGDLNALNTTEQVESCNIDIKPDTLKDSTNIKSINVYDTIITFCPLCDASYENVNGLTNHMQEYHKEILGPGKRGRPKKKTTTVTSEKLLNNDNSSKTKPLKRLNCSFCKEKFESEDELATHISEHKDKVYSCAVCKKRYMKKSYFDIHLCIEEKVQGDTQMSDSPLSLQTKGEQDEFLIETSLQELAHLNNNNKGACIWWQECTSCSILLSTPAELVAHVDAKHPHRSLQCPLCNKVFESVSSARQHRVRCTSVDHAHACSSCPQRFAREASLNKHILSSHAGQQASVKFVAASTAKRYQCDTCKRYFFRKDLLTKHMKHHTSNKYFQCDICMKRFYRNDNLRSHMRVHGGAGGRSAATCLCLYCGRSFTCSSNFIVHMRRHTGEKPYKCDFCGKGFPRSSDLQCHRRSHTGEKPYVCEICEKGFARSNKLSRHMRVHTGAKPYKCTYCDKAFSQSNDLNLHVRRHTGDKPYVCDLCGDRFIQGSALQSHRRTHGHYSQLEVANASLSLPSSLLLPSSLSLPLSLSFTNL